MNYISKMCHLSICSGFELFSWLNGWWRDFKRICHLLGFQQCPQQMFFFVSAFRKDFSSFVQRFRLVQGNLLAMIDAYLYYSRKLLCRESNPGLKVKSRFMIDMKGWHMIKIQSSQSCGSRQGSVPLREVRLWLCW